MTTATKSKKEVKVIDIGGIELPYNNESDPQYVPKTPHPFIDNNGVLSTIAYGIQNSLPVLMIGETGTGKTSAIRDLAHRTNNSFRRLNLNGSTTVEEFVGKILINRDGTYWTDGILTDAMRNGHWLLIDEVNAALPEILFVLQSLLDDDGYIVLAEKEDKEVVRPHPNFRIFATMNPFEDYVGTKELNKAFLSRFPITIKVDYPKPDQEFAIVKERYPALDDETIKSMIEVAKTTRESRANEEVDFVFSTRDLLQWAQVYQHTMSARRSALMTFIPKCNKNDAKALSSYIGLNFVEDETDVLNVRKGASIRIKEQIVMTKPPKVIVPGSILKILERVSIDPNDPQYQKAGDPGLLRKIKDSVRVEWVSVPKQSELVLLNEVFVDDENYSRVVKEGEQWAVPAEDLNGKFMVVKKTK